MSLDNNIYFLWAGIAGIILLAWVLIIAFLRVQSD